MRKIGFVFRGIIFDSGDSIVFDTIAYIQPAQSAEAPTSDEQLQIEQALPEGFVFLDEALPGVSWDAKYATEQNFTGQIVTGYLSDRVVISKKMVSALEKARDLAAEKGYGLLVWDAARPQRAVDWFVEWSKLPEDDKSRQQHYPNIKKTQLFQEGYVARRSGHSRGAAIDLTLVELESGTELDMGTIFDFMDVKSRQGAKGLSAVQRENREALNAIMKASGFTPYSGEWWHFTMNNEPFPGQYFDFVISGSAEKRDEELPPEEIVPANPMRR